MRQAQRTDARHPALPQEPLTDGWRFFHEHASVRHRAPLRSHDSRARALARAQSRRAEVASQSNLTSEGDRVMARQPQVLNDLVLDRIVRVVRAGIDPDVAAGFAGILPETFAAWMERGARGRRGKYRTLYEQVTEAAALAEADATQNVRKAAQHDW